MGRTARTLGVVPGDVEVDRPCFRLEVICDDVVIEHELIEIDPLHRLGPSRPTLHRQRKRREIRAMLVRPRGVPAPST